VSEGRNAGIWLIASATFGAATRAKASASITVTGVGAVKPVLRTSEPVTTISFCG
jgi:hypothetical protein